MIGQVFGRLTVIAFSHFGENYGRGCLKWWLCKCECGNRHTASSQVLRRNKNGCKSCGCLRREMARTKLKKGHATLTRRAAERRMVAVE
jgi:hypothetical protein